MSAPSSSLLRVSSQLTRASRCARKLHTTPRRSDRVAPPHPISHIRPIIYKDSVPASPPTLLRHPYSLAEFHPNEGSANPSVELELQFKMLRQQLDSFHQAFWLDVRCLSSQQPLRMLTGTVDFLLPGASTNFRIISVTMPRKKQPSPPSQALLQTLTQTQSNCSERTHYRSSIPTGTLKRRSVRTNTRESGGGETSNL